MEFHEAALEVARRAGICLKSARERLRKRERGLLTDEQLYKPYMPGCPRECRRENQWGDLGLGPRRRLDDIQGSTALERAWNAADDAGSGEERKPRTAARRKTKPEAKP